MDTKINPDKTSQDFAILGNLTRLEILLALNSEKELTKEEIAEAINRKPGDIYAQLDGLRKSHLIERSGTRKDGMKFKLNIERFSQMKKCLDIFAR